MKKGIVLIMVLLVVSCKAKKTLAESAASGNLSATTIINNHYNNKFDFSTLYIKANVKYKDDKNAQTVTADIKIQNNQKILVSVRFLGFTVAKALITPTEVKYYEKISGNYFEGNYVALSNWLGTDLDYNKVQNLLLGYAIDDLNMSKYDVEVVEKLFKLTDKNSQKTQKNFYFEAKNFTLKKQEIIQELESRRLQVDYNEFHKVEDKIFPLTFKIEARQNTGRNIIEVEYKNITLNEELSFPYSVPDGYDRIYIDK
jgi:hypothetical protein